MVPPSESVQLQEAIEREFQCHRCGHCCKGDGLVHFGAGEADAMACELGLTRRRFLRMYAIRVDASQWILKDRLVETPSLAHPEVWCTFLECGADGLYSCRVNAAKPQQCREFPAKWRNPDSFRTCLGLRVLMRKLKSRVENLSSK